MYLEGKSNWWTLYAKILAYRGFTECCNTNEQDKFICMIWELRRVLTLIKIF